MEYIHRNITETIKQYLLNFPAVAILGPRQCGKSTLAKHITSEFPSINLDLERIADRNKLQEPEMFFKAYQDKLICLDEIQNIPGIFSSMRSVIDENQRNSQFLILGSASRDLIRQSSETLAGRIVFVYLTPFTCQELFSDSVLDFTSIASYLIKGGFPRSYLAQSQEMSYVWRSNFIETFLQRDLPQMGFNIPPEIASRLWKICAHSQGQLLNASRFGETLGYNYQTIKSYLNIFQGTFMLRLLPPFLPNIKKRLVKSSKLYIRDTGILSALLNIRTMEELMGHPAFGPAWETLVIENILNEYPDWEYGFYRTSHGAEVDLVLEKHGVRTAVECKASLAPKPSKGFYQAMDDLGIEKGYIVAPIEGPAYPVNERAIVISLMEFLNMGL